MTGTPLIEADGLRLARGGREIFHIERFALAPGEVLALVGPNGAGKSSLLLTLALLEPPTGGSIRFAGVPVRNGNLLAFRRRLALVFQDALLLDMPVLANLLIPLRFRGLGRREAAARAEAWLDRLGIRHLAKHPARTLSGGEAQRTSLARALALEPELLLLDEPFSSLDYPTRKKLLDDLGAILAKLQTATLFVTHDYTEIPRIAGRVAVLHQGRILRTGTVREVFGDDLADRRIRAPWEED